jgi:hypothetical protein
MELFGLLFALLLATLILIVLREPFRRFLQPEWDFFVSHRSTDIEIIIPIVDKLKGMNYRVWIDLDEIDEERSKDRFRRPISLGIQRSSFVLLFTSEEYCKSDYCRQEAFFFINRFAKQPHRIIEIRLDNIDVRNILGIPSTSLCLNFSRGAVDRDKEEPDMVLVNRIIFYTKKRYKQIR